MKKIVALVLCLVLALSLCTVAFADTTSGGDSTTTEIKANAGYVIKKVSDNSLTVEKTAITKTVKTPYVVNDGVTTTTTYYADKYAVSGGNTYYAVADDSAEYKLLDKNGALITALIQVDNDVEVSSSTTVTKIAKDADLNCGAYYYNDATGTATATAAFEDTDGDAYIAAKAQSNSYVVYNGKLLAVDTAKTALTVPHVFLKDNLTYKTVSTSTSGRTVVAATCDNCKKTFDVVSSLAVNYNDTYAIIGTTTGYATAGTSHKVGSDLIGKYVLFGTAGTTAAGTTTVESAKTFDAGIALYAGMALASVAGSAVVIGKKKEF